MFEVYGEYLFIENLLMNWLILHLTAYFSKAEAHKYRIWIGAVLGALYAFVFFFPSLYFMYSFFMKIIVSMLMIIIVFTPYKFREFVKLIGIFYLISFMFGGAAFALFYLTDFTGLLSNGIFYFGNFTLKILIYSGIMAYILIRFCLEYIQVKISREKICIPICIQVENHKSRLKALLDTGNSLQDPLSKYPVIVVEYNAIKDLLPLDVQSILNDSVDVNLDLISKIITTSEWINRFRIIPFKSLGKENGMLIGFKPDCVQLEDKKDNKSISKIIIGIYTKKLSTNGDYSALLHPDILK
jgi:stage II sporulation protein GA (sporulation sigma-E factor processing peptidase)